jgi:hypothetical protein
MVLSLQFGNTSVRIGAAKKDIDSRKHCWSELSVRVASEPKKAFVEADVGFDA